MPGHDIKVWPVRPKRGQGHGLRAHKYPAAQLFPSAGRKKPQKLIILKEKEENQRKGRKEGRESRRREKEEKVFWVPPRTFITKFEVRPGNLNCYQLRVSPSPSRSLVFKVLRQIWDQSWRKLTRRQSIRTITVLRSSRSPSSESIPFECPGPQGPALLDSWSHPLPQLCARVVRKLPEEAGIEGCLSWGQECHNSFPSFRPAPLPSCQMFSMGWTGFSDSPFSLWGEEDKTCHPARIGGGRACVADNANLGMWLSSGSW